MPDPGCVSIGTFDVSDTALHRIADTLTSRLMIGQLSTQHRRRSAQKAFGFVRPELPNQGLSQAEHQIKRRSQAVSFSSLEQRLKSNRQKVTTQLLRLPRLYCPARVWCQKCNCHIGHHPAWTLQHYCHLPPIFSISPPTLSYLPYIRGIIIYQKQRCVWPPVVSPSRVLL